MHLTPAQFGMCLLTHGTAHSVSYATLAEGIANGRYLLMRCTQHDFGYDIKAWHDYLAAKKMYSPRSRHKAGIYPVEILNAMSDQTWIEAVRAAESTALLEQIQESERQRRQATDVAEREWAGKHRNCPKCKTIFKSVRNRGQCPQCGWIFFASHPDGNPGW